MKLDEMKVQYDKTRDGFTKESSFEVKQEKPLPKMSSPSRPYSFAWRIAISSRFTAMGYSARI